jgi:hypothetical protein
MRVRNSIIGLLVAIAASTVVIAQESNQATNLTHKILDLVFRVEDLGGKVQDLQVKETGQEIRIELAADVLFELIKPICDPQRRKLCMTLRQSSRSEPKAMCESKATQTQRATMHTIRNSRKDVRRQ